MLISINRCGLAAKPGRDFDWSTYNTQFISEDIPLVEVMGHITHGNSFAAVFDGDRSQENFVLAQHIALDIDGGMTLDEIKAHPFVRAYAGFVYPSMSWTPEAERYRILFEISAPIRGAEPYRAALETVHDMFPLADRACIDPARQFYGNSRILSDDLPHWFMDNTLPLEDLRLFYKQMVAKRRAELNQAQDRLKAASPSKRPAFDGSGKRAKDLTADEIFALLAPVDPYAMSYNDWFRLGCATAHLDSGAFFTFKRWSDRPGKTPLTEAKWRSMCQHGQSSAGYGTIVHIMRTYGVAV